MLKKVAEKDNRDWDCRLRYLLFSIREGPKASTGLFLFELLYSQHPCGPLDVPKETSELESTPYRNVIKHVAQLQERIAKPGLGKSSNQSPGNTLCAMRMEEAKYLGYVISRGEIKPHINKVEVIQSWLKPLSKKHIRVFLDIVGYYFWFISNFAMIAATLMDILKGTKSAMSKWSAEAKTAFEGLKLALCKQPVVLAPDFSKAFVVLTDASDVGLCAVLSQEVNREEINISYGATNPLLSNKKLYPSFFQTLPSDQTQYLAIVKLLKHFDWTWIGVLASDDDGGHTQTQELMKQAEVYDICIEFILKMKTDDFTKEENSNEKNRRIFQKSTSNIIVLCGTISFLTVQFIEEQSISGKVKTLIIPAGSNIHILSSVKRKASCDGSLIFSAPNIKIPQLKTFLEDISLENRPNDPILEHILMVYLSCKPSNPILKMLAENYYPHKLKNCNKTMKLPNIGSNHYNTETFRTTYHVYTAVYAMAHALHEGLLHMPRNFNCKHMLKFQEEHKEIMCREAQIFEQPLSEEADSGERQLLSQKVDTVVNTLCQVNKSGRGQSNEVEVEVEDDEITDKVACRASKVAQRVKDQQHRNSKEEAVACHREKAINCSPDPRPRIRCCPIWCFFTESAKDKKTIPVSKCTEDCPPGYRRILMNGSHKCCFECLQCSDGEISNETDKRSCIRCPRDQWPNDSNQCAPKETEFLSYTDDSITLIITLIVIFLFLKTSFILGIFTLFRDTPVVKASNQSLSFSLLVSIMISFLCVFLFLGRPTRVTCMLRQTSFGIIFSVAISSILAKTFMVYSAFKATKPGSKCRKFIGVKITNCLVYVCSFTQVVLCIIWLSTAPPFPENNFDLYVDKIILQCNEGSIVAFSIILGYIGFLAAVSFLVAFLARNLPDSFNEAKYITFSMLVVCSVWVAFIPAYLSVTGKSSVLVEIFAILSSSVGILACIFYPKCYIIILRPDLNSKGHLLKKSKYGRENLTT
ncbi:vomeronasal type-2 receptor 26-like [Dendrobates tinctorius]|uniref:vomeronasal type-2 receptor 26-like n=1 Tax=Dendrobates tinctorius TaxID=92724 RepID=UPI003CC9F9EC